MDKSAFLRFMQADPNVYDKPGQEVTPSEIRRREMYAELTGGMGSDYDYDKFGGRGNGGHGTDFGKLPWHPTFSNQSRFVTEEMPGGVWGNNSYAPGPGQEKYMSDQALANYMLREEPDVQLKARR